MQIGSFDHIQTINIWILSLGDEVQPAFTYLKLTIETLEQGVKFVQS